MPFSKVGGGLVMRCSATVVCDISDRGWILVHASLRSSANRWWHGVGRSDGNIGGGVIRTASLQLWLLRGDARGCGRWPINNMSSVQYRQYVWQVVIVS
jgi:hypothetical protein